MVRNEIIQAYCIHQTPAMSQSASGNLKIFYSTREKQFLTMTLKEIRHLVKLLFTLVSGSCIAEPIQS